MAMDDPNQLLSLARDRSAEGREALAKTIAGLFGDEDSVLSEREQTLIFEILRQIVRDTEMSVRRIISAQLATIDETPEELASFLANDDIEVAFPILTQSTVLKDATLIEVVRNRALEHQLAISIRYAVSENVTEALVQEGDENVILNLLRNSGAEISNSTMEYLVEQSKRVNSFQEPILRRDDLNPELAKRMFMWVSAALRQFIGKRFELDQAVMDDLLEKAALDAAGEDATAREGSNKADKLASSLAQQGDVTPELLVGALKNSQVHLFISMFRQMTGLRQNLITRFLLEPTGEGLAISCRAMGITEADFTTIYSLCSQVRSSNGRSPVEESAQAATELFRNIAPMAAMKVVQYWRRDVDYLAAIRELEISTQANG